MPKALIVEIFANAKQFGEELERAAGKTRRFSKAAGFAGLAIAGGLAYGLEKSVVSASKFQENMELIHTQAGKSQAAVAKLSTGVLNLAGPTATAPDTLAEGMYHLASQGLKGKKALDALNVAAKGATIGHANLEDVTNALGAAIASGIKGVKDLDGAMGMMNATVGAGDMRMQDLADAMGTGLLANAKLAGVSLRDVDSALAVFGDNNIRGSKAGNILNSTFRVMNATSGAGVAALKEHGISASVMANKLAGPGGLVSALEYLQGGLKKAGLGSVESSALLTKAFGGRQASGIRLLMGQIERLKTKEEEVGKGAGKFGEAWKATTQTTAFKFRQMKESMSAVGVNIGTALLPAVTKMVSWLAKATGWLSQHRAATKVLVIALGGLAAALITISLVTKAAGAAQKIWGALVKVNALSAKALGLAQAESTAATEANTVATEGNVVATEAQSFASKAAAAAQWLFNAAMDASPIVIVIAAVAALGIAAYELYKHWDTVSAFFVGLWNDIKGIFSEAVQWVEGHWKLFLGLPGLVWQYWGPISSFFGNLWGRIKGAFNSAIGWLKSHWKIFLGLPGLVWQYWGPISSFFSGLWHDVEGIFNSAVGFMRRIGGKIASAFSSAIRGGLGIITGAINMVFIDPINALIGLIDSIKLPAVGFSIFGHHIGFPGWGGFGIPKIPTLDSGGDVLKTGLAVVHRGESFSGVHGQHWRRGGGGDGPAGMAMLARSIRHGLFDSMTPTGGGGGSSSTAGHFTAEIPIIVPLMDGRVLRAQRSVALRAESRGNTWGDA